MKNEKPTNEDMVFIYEHFSPNPQMLVERSINLSTIEPKLTKRERSMIRLSSYIYFVSIQFKRLEVARIKANLIFDNTRRNCGCAGGIIENESLHHRFMIMDTGINYEVLVINDEPVYLSFNRFSEAVDYILLVYWQCGLINKIPVYEDGHLWEPGPCVPAPDIPRRPLTPAEEIIRKEWQQGIINLGHEDFSHQYNLTESERTLGYEMLRSSGLYAGSINEDNMWACYGGTGVDILEDDEDPEQDFVSYTHDFLIEEHKEGWGITRLDHKAANLIFTSFIDAVNKVISHYRGIGLASGHID